MFKKTTTSNFSFNNSTLLLMLPGEGKSSQFCLSLLKQAYDFENVGYLYSEFTNYQAGYQSEEDMIPSFNGQIYYNKTNNITILDFSYGIILSDIHWFYFELKNFVEENQFKDIYVLSSCSKDNCSDFELMSSNINVYSLQNNSQIEQNCNLLSFKESYKINELNREGKQFKEMLCLEGCEEAQRLIQYLLIEKQKFIFIFVFADSLFDPLAGLSLFNKIRYILKLVQNDEKVLKNNLTKSDQLEEISKTIKISQKWKNYLVN